MKNTLTLIAILLGLSTYAQKDLSVLLKEINTQSAPYIYVDSLKGLAKDVILLDAREKKEFKVSHLKNAMFVGYTTFNLNKTMKNLPNKDAKIVVYCSLGIRSEDIAEKLVKAGYTNVLNLYGGIFEWKNNNHKVYTSKNKETEKVHAFDKNWGIWLKKGKKVYE